MFYIYVLKSNVSEKYYTGQTEDLDKRLEEHNSGKSTYTKRYIPWSVVYFEEALNREDAVKREKYLKSSAGRRWLKKNAQVLKLVDKHP